MKSELNCYPGLWRNGIPCMGGRGFISRRPYAFGSLSCPLNTRKRKATTQTPKQHCRLVQASICQGSFLAHIFDPQACVPGSKPHILWGHVHGLPPRTNQAKGGFRRTHGCGCQNRFGIPFWLVSEFTTHFRTYFSDWDVHWGYGILTHGHMSESESTLGSNTSLPNMVKKRGQALRHTRTSQ